MIRSDNRQQRISRNRGPADLTVRREIAASAEELFDAWLDPVSLAAWMAAGDVARADARVSPSVGGSFEILLHRASGLIRHAGHYRLIERPRRLAFTWRSAGREQGDTLITVDFRAARSGRTEVVLRQETLRSSGAEAAVAGADGRAVERILSGASDCTPCETAREANSPRGRVIQPIEGTGPASSR